MSKSVFANLVHSLLRVESAATAAHVVAASRNIRYAGSRAFSRLTGSYLSNYRDCWGRFEPRRGGAGVRRWRLALGPSLACWRCSALTQSTNAIFGSVPRTHVTSDNCRLVVARTAAIHNHNHNQGTGCMRSIHYFESLLL